MDDLLLEIDEVNPSADAPARTPANAQVNASTVAPAGAPANALVNAPANEAIFGPDWACRI